LAAVNAIGIENFSKNSLCGALCILSLQMTCRFRKRLSVFSLYGLAINHAIGGGDQEETAAMDKEIEAFEKRAERASRLKEKAAIFLKQASEIEAAQKPAFEAIILKAAYTAGLDRLPLKDLVTQFAKLQASRREANPENEAEPGVEAFGRDDEQIQAADATIDLTVKIGRNTTRKRFAVLDQYLSWNGKEGHWSGKVNPAVLKIFEELFEPKRLIHSAQMRDLVENGSPNTSPDIDCDVVSATGPDDLTPAKSAVRGDVNRAQPIAVHDHVAEQPVTIEPVAGERQEAEERMDTAEPAEGPQETASVGDSPEAGEMSSNAARGDAGADVVVSGGTGPQPGEPPLVTPVPHSPFSALRRRSTS
jgi:hypothetical protein